VLKTFNWIFSQGKNSLKHIWYNSTKHTGVRADPLARAQPPVGPRVRKILLLLLSQVLVGRVTGAQMFKFAQGAELPRAGPDLSAIVQVQRACDNRRRYHAAQDTPYVQSRGDARSTVTLGLITRFSRGHPTAVTRAGLREGGNCSGPSAPRTPLAMTFILFKIKYLFEKLWFKRDTKIQTLYSDVALIILYIVNDFSATLTFCQF